MSSEPVSAENNWPERSLPPPQGDHGHSGLSLSADHGQKLDNMVLPVHEGSTPSSGQNGIINNTPLVREDHHLSRNAAALVAGASLPTFPLDVVAPNSGTEKVTSQKSKQLAENDLFIKIDSHCVNSKGKSMS